jgi:hypothetical protein
VNSIKNIKKWIRRKFVSKRDKKFAESFEFSLHIVLDSLNHYDVTVEGKPPVLFELFLESIANKFAEKSMADNAKEYMKQQLIKRLIDRRFITNSKPYRITDRGKEFMANGGFLSEYVKKRQEAKDRKIASLSYWAIGVSILNVILLIVFGILTHKDMLLSNTSKQEIIQLQMKTDSLQRQIFQIQSKTNFQLYQPPNQPAKDATKKVP